jgi:hypothetical protein
MARASSSVGMVGQMAFTVRELSGTSTQIVDISELAVSLAFSAFVTKRESPSAVATTIYSHNIL